MNENSIDIIIDKKIYLLEKKNIDITNDLIDIRNLINKKIKNE